MTQLNTQLAVQAETDEQLLVCFRLADEEFGVEINTVREIVRLPEITHVPLTPAFVRGIANLRGNVLPIIDCRRRFALPDREATEQTRVLVIDAAGLVTGIVVDGVSEVLRVPAAAFENPPPVTQGGVSGDFLKTVVKFDKGHRLIMTIWPERVANMEASAAKSETYSQEKAGRTKTETKARSGRELMEKQLVSFSLGREEYAFDITVVKEILRKTEITKVPNTGSEVKGLLTLRNSLVPILDLRTMLDLAPFDDDDQRILVVEMDGILTGLLVDKVNEVVRVPVEAMDEAEHLSAAGKELKSVVRLDEGRRLILVLDEKGLVDFESMSELLAQEVKGEESEGQDREARKDMEEEQLVTFVVGEEEFGIRITQVQEINRLAEITKVPKTASFVAGVTNLRGHVIPLIDLRLWFQVAGRDKDDRTRVIIVDLNGQRTGFIVDQVNEVLRLAKGNIEPPPRFTEQSEAGQRGQFIAGIGKANDGKRMILILDVEKMLTKSEQQALLGVSSPAGTGETAKSGQPEKTKKKKKTGKEVPVKGDDGLVIEE